MCTVFIVSTAAACGAPDRLANRYMINRNVSLYNGPSHNTAVAFIIRPTYRLSANPEKSLR